LNIVWCIILVLMFVVSVMFLIVSPNVISILLGWDGLGLVCNIVRMREIYGFHLQGRMCWQTFNQERWYVRIHTVHNETNLIHYVSSVYSVTVPLHVSGLLVAHHHGVTMCICNKWYVLYVLVFCLPVATSWSVPTAPLKCRTCVGARIVVPDRRVLSTRMLCVWLCVLASGQTVKCIGECWESCILVKTYRQGPSLLL
jgi:hypothetical protein